MEITKPGTKPVHEVSKETLEVIPSELHAENVELDLEGKVTANLLNHAENEANLALRKKIYEVYPNLEETITALDMLGYGREGKVLKFDNESSHYSISYDNNKLTLERKNFLGYDKFKLDVINKGLKTKVYVYMEKFPFWTGSNPINDLFLGGDESPAYYRTISGAGLGLAPAAISSIVNFGGVHSGEIHGGLFIGGVIIGSIIGLYLPKIKDAIKYFVNKSSLNLDKLPYISDRERQLNILKEVYNVPGYVSTAIGSEFETLKKKLDEEKAKQKYLETQFIEEVKKLK